MENTNFDAIWQAILAHAGETFHIPSGPFTYTAHGSYIISSRARSTKLFRSNFQKALPLLDVLSPAQFRDTIIGPSYVKAILSDPRITGKNK